ncbi:MAG TPA: hypothetical protein VIE65_13820, partial [Methylobacter sp.]
SKNGCVDIVFNRFVGPFSSSAIFTIQDSAGGPAVPMTQLNWMTESIPADTVRVQLPGGTPTAQGFKINYSGVVDISLNVGTDSVPLTLALYRKLSPGSLSLSDLSHIRITRAVVVNVSSRKMNYATVRIFFNGPTLNASDIENWTFSLPGLHTAAASGPSAVSSPNASDLTTCITLANEEKLRFNNHISYANAHGGDVSSDVVISPNATDLPTLITLIHELALNINTHFHRGLPFHTYRTDGTISGTPIDLASCISFANSIKSFFNTHILASIPTVPISLGVTAISPINDHSSYSAPNTVFDVRSEYNYYTEFRIACNAENIVLPILCAATVTSADGLSVTNPTDPTGLIYATAVVDDVTDRTKTDIPELYIFGLAPSVYYSKIPALSGPVAPEISCDIFMMGADFVLPEPSNFLLNGPDGLEDIQEISLSATLPSILWALNELIFSYATHIRSPANGGAAHLTQDFNNIIIDPNDYAQLPLSTFFVCANSLKSKMNAHMQSVVYHFQSGDLFINSPDAVDIPTLIALIDEMREILLLHNASIGPHSAAGAKVLCAPLYDLIRVFPSEMIHEAIYSLSGSFRTKMNLIGSFFEQTFLTPGSTGGELIKDISYTEPFPGIAMRPSVASAIPRSGLVINEEDIFFLPDTIEVFFSKTMRQIPLDASNFAIAGGSIIQKGIGWVSDTIAAVNVIKMESMSYNLSVSNLTDASGNLIYP